MSTEPESLILQMLREMRADMARLEGNIASKDDIRELQADFSSLRADVASDVLTLHKELGGQIVGLRRAVVEYHTSVIGMAC